MRRLILILVAVLWIASSRAADAQQPIVVTGNGQITTFSSGGPQQPGQVAPPRDNQQPLPPGTSTLRGRVTAGDSGQPLRKAQVRLTGGPVSPGTGQTLVVNGQAVTVPDNRLATTDANGRFEFKDVRAGRYQLNAQKSSYIGLSWGQQRLNEPGKPIDVLDGQTIEKLDFTLPRGGVVTGRVVDEFGDPAADISVSAMRSQSVGGTRRLVSAGRASQTNDIGEFRIYALPPGDYYVSATWRNQNPQADDDRSGYAPTYYPGTADAAAAQKLTVAAGQTITDITLPLLPIRTSRVSGTAVDSQGRPLRGTVQAFARTTMLGGGPIGIQPGPIRPDGTFTINGLTPGDYTLEVPNQPALGGPAAPPGEQEYASLDISVNGDVSGVRIVSTKPSNVTGRIVIASGDAQSFKSSTVRIGVQPVPTGGIIFGPMPQPEAINDDLTFHSKARAGLMRINTLGLQPPWTIKAIRNRGTDVTDTGFDVRPGEDVTDLEVELTNKTTEVSGAVTNARGEPVQSYWVVFFGRDRDKWRPPSRYIRINRSGQDGRFRMTGLPAGDYYVIASDTLDPNDATDPDFLDKMSSRATRFTLSEADTKTLDLKLTPIP